MANRNRIAMSAEIFARLIRHAGDERTIPAPTAPRYIRRLSDDDAELMAKAELSSLTVTRQIRIVRIEWQEALTFCVFGVAPPEIVPSGLVLGDLTPGTFSTSIIQADIRPRTTVTPYDILDVIGDRHGGVDGYDGHDLVDITPLFPEAIVLHVSDKADYQESKHRVMGAIIARTYFDGPISLNPRTIEKITDLLESGSEYVPFRNILQGVLSVSWENLYIEMYRCLEQLYPAPRIAKLRQELGSRVSLRDLARLFEERLGWRPKEEDALREVILDCAEETVRAAYRYLVPGGQKLAHSERARVVARCIYDIRNRIVHYRSATEVISKTDEEWNNLICALVDLVGEAYDSHGDSYFRELAEIA